MYLKNYAQIYSRHNVNESFLTYPAYLSHLQARVDYHLHNSPINSDPVSFTLTLKINRTILIQSLLIKSLKALKCSSPTQ